MECPFVLLFVPLFVNCMIDLLNGQTANLQDSSSEDGISPQKESPNDDSEILRKAKEEGVVDVLFSGYVTKEACCKFVCEILKCILYQRQQLPMTYDQLKHHQKQQQQQHASTQVRSWKDAGYYPTSSYLFCVIVLCMIFVSFVLL